MHRTQIQRLVLLAGGRRTRHGWRSPSRACFRVDLTPHLSLSNAFQAPAYRAAVISACSHACQLPTEQCPSANLLGPTTIPDA